MPRFEVSAMRHNANFKSHEEVEAAYTVALWGGVAGAARWGLFAALLGTAAHVSSPVFRRVTVQYKVFLGLASVTMGGMIEADRRMVAHEVVVRQRKRWERDNLARREYERTLAEEEEEIDEKKLEEQIRRDEIRSLKSRRRSTET